MHRCWILLAVIFVCAGAVEAQVRITNGGDLTLQDLAEGRKLVTVVLKTGATEQNLKIVGVFDKYFSSVDSKGEFSPFLFDDVREVRVQDEAIAEREFKVEETRVLRAEDLLVVDQAVNRAKEIFQQADDRVDLKMRAAAILALHNDESAREYLTRRLGGNDLQQALDAGIALYVAGNTPQSKADSIQIARRGLQSINRRARATAAHLVGLLGYADSETAILDMLRDRTPELFAPAARAAGRLGLDQAIPALATGIAGLNTEKAEAAVDGLIAIGGPEVTARMREMVDRETGFARFRVVRVLYALEDPLGLQLLQEEYFSDPTFRDPEQPANPSFILARDGYAEAISFLLEELDEVVDPTLENLLYKARAAGALIQGGHTPAVSDLQRYLRLDPSGVVDRGALPGELEQRQKAIVTELRNRICLMAADIGARRLIPILQPVVIGSGKAHVILAACEAIVAISDPEFRTRVLGARQ